MPADKFNLLTYLNRGIENIVNGIVKATLTNPRESLFAAQYAAASKRAKQLRGQAESKGTHIPPFLIASITNRCNLHCQGCYARANNSCVDAGGPLKPTDGSMEMLGDKRWDSIFKEASKIGVGFILLAGGEPFMRLNVLKAAAKYKNILFPVFTNGTMLDSRGLRLLDENRNLLPILSLEGKQEATDARRGTGVYRKLLETMKALHRRGILFGASVTVTRENRIEVLSEDFVQQLRNTGCLGVIYVEYVPVSKESEELAITEKEREDMSQRLLELRKKKDKMIFISFPGDEKSSGGCLAAGRGFFHINPNGQAEPCPFSPYSDTSLKEKTLLEVLESPLFKNLQNNGNLMREHMGGCVLFEQREAVKEMAGGN